MPFLLFGSIHLTDLGSSVIILWYPDSSAEVMKMFNLKLRKFLLKMNN